MAQGGFHGLLGLMAGPALVRRLPLTAQARRMTLLGFVLGNFLPDADVYAALMVAPLVPSLAESVHRGFTHSLLGAALPVLGLSLASRLAGHRELLGLGVGLSLGMLAHIGLDILFWFAGVDLLWPLGTLGLAPIIHLWQWWEPPVVLQRLLAAGEYLAFGLYFAYLAHLAQYTGKGLRMGEVARQLRSQMLRLSAIMVLLALFLETLPFNLLHYALWSLVAFPSALYVTFRMDSTLFSLLHEASSR